MENVIREYKECDLKEMTEIWNHIVWEGNAFPQEEIMSLEEAEMFFKEQTYIGVAEENGVIVGLYILHPNNIGRCGHIANASYAVKAGQRGKKIGERLVKDSLQRAGQYGFRILQFNAVVADNARAIHLYEKLGFTQLGRIPGGFKKKNGNYEDIFPYYIEV